MRAAASVRLGVISTSNAQFARACATSDSASRPLGKQPQGCITKERQAQGNQSHQRCQRTRAHHIDRLQHTLSCDLFYARGMNLHRDPGAARDLGEERRFAPIAFDEGDAGTWLLVGHDRDDETWEAGAAADVEPGPRVGREGQKLGAIGDMAMPDLGKRGPGDQIDPRLPLLEQGHVELKLIKCFT